MNQIVAEAIVGRLADPDSDCAGKHLAAIVDVTIAEFVGSRLLRGLVPEGGFADLQAAGAEVAKFAPRDPIALAPASEFERVIAEV